ncbi:MAG: hypothetical protein IPP49_09445 [Saprospiraceae bacterium]|nr:hypothetical protein [Saprospiraceae bacterium]
MRIVQSLMLESTISPMNFQCPINTGRIYRPESPLSVLNGSAMKGKWTLRLENKRPVEEAGTIWSCA